MSKKNNCVCFGITSNLTFAVANVIIGIEHFSPNLVDKYCIIYDVDDPITLEEQNVLRRITDNIEFIEYQLSEDIKLPSSIVERYSKLNLSKFEIFRLLDFYKKVLWLDADILIQGDISEIFNYRPMAWRKTVEAFNKKLESWEGIPINDEFTAPNGGVILVTDDIKDHIEIYKNSFMVLHQLMQISNRISLDELTFAVLNFKYRIGATLLPAKFNSGTGWKNSQNALIVHSIGKLKFWNDAVRYGLFPLWGSFYNKYIEVGGSYRLFELRYSDILGKEAKSFENAFENYVFWDKLLKEARFSNYIIQSHCLFKRYFQIYIYGIKRTTHYELIRESGKIVVALHFEKDSFVQLGVNSSFVQKLLSSTKCASFKLEIIEKRIAIFKVVEEECALQNLNKLISLTLHLLVFNNLKVTSLFGRLKNILKYYYRILK